MQLSYTKAEYIAANAAVLAMGFGPRRGKVAVSAEEVYALAQRAAYIALSNAGLLRDADAQNGNDKLAQKAKSREASFEQRSRS